MKSKGYKAKTASDHTVQEPAMAYSTEAFSSTLSFLGGKSYLAGASIQGKFDFIQLIRRGISHKSLNFLMKATGISPSEMAGIIHTSDRTLRRYTADDTVLNPEQSERALELARLYSRGEEVFGGIEAFNQWMNNPVTALGSKKPKEFLDTSIGFEMLMEELGRIEYGVFA